MTRYAIGDIHGCFQELRDLLTAIGPGHGDTVIFLGDYIDRGPDSKAVLDLLMNLPLRGIKTICLKGNHEVLMLEALEKGDPVSLDVWLRNGGGETLASFGLDPLNPTPLPEPYWSWVVNLPVSYRSGSFLCVHAGLDLQSDDPLADQHAMLWIRNWFNPEVMALRFPGLRVLHGHSPQPRFAVEFAHQQKLQALDLDTGCVYLNRHPEMGWLCAYNLDLDRLHFQRNHSG